MGTRQVYRGNPTQKLFWNITNFSGGMNTLSIDDAMGDYEYRELINTELGKNGILQNRKGFGEINVFNNLLSFYDITLPSGSYNFFKAIVNTNVILENIIENENYTYQWVVSDIDYWTDNGEVDGSHDIISPSELETPTAINVAGRISDGGDPASYTYYRSIYKFTGTLKILMIIDNLIKLLSYDGTTMTLSTLQNNSKDLPSVSSYATNLTNVNFVEHINKIYISLNDVSDYYKGILVYDRDDDTWTTWRGQYNLLGVWTDFDSDLLTDVYKPKPYDISTSLSNVTQGFNVLTDEPLLYIDDQGTGLETIRNIILTDTSGGNYLEKIPTSGDFVINLIKTGSYNFKPENIRFEFKNEDDELLDFEIGDVGLYGYDTGGYFEYKISDLNVTGSSYVLISAYYNNKIIERKGLTLTDISTGALNILNNYYCPFDEFKAYKVTSSGGTDIGDYTVYDIDYRYETSDVSTTNPSDVGVFDYLMILGNDGKYFQLIDTTNNEHRLFTYNHGTTSFTEITATDGILYESKDYFIPKNGTLIDIGDAYPFYVYYYKLITDYDYTAFGKKYVNENTTVVDLEGQYFEIGDTDVEEPIEGLDLENVKIVEIDDKLLYYNGNTIYFSSVYQFDYVPNFSYLILPILSTDEIQNIKYFNGSWIIFTKYTIWKMIGTYGDDDWTVQQINTHIGCIAPKSIRAIENTLYFLSENGLYSLKQNYYVEGLENVFKLDKNVPELFPKKINSESIYWNEQYILYTPNYDYDAIRLYANIKLPDKLHPIVVDNFAVYPSNIYKESWNLLSIKNGKLYVYNNGYTDFLPSSTTEVDDYIYSVRIITPRLNIGYPTHNKKFKSLYIKTYYNGNSTLYITGLVDEFVVIDPKTYLVTINDDGELEYNEYDDPDLDSNLSTELTIGNLGTYKLGETPLGDSPYTTHKVVVGSKGKNIQLIIEHKSNANFGIVSLGILYKLGKVKERA